MSELKPGDELSGFVVKSVQRLKTAPAILYELEHPVTGAKLVHYSCDDAENLFSINFPTPPSDNTGIPHIMEHSVLSGSEKFPLKDPFFAIAKISMATFLNAMTGTECTYYPVASNVRQDIINLADIYFDAVFHPLLTLNTFEREAHHLAPADPESPRGDLTVRGVVYNEMLAYAASPDYRFWYQPMVNLLENTIYVFEAGGDPGAIPDLTYEQFRNFHRAFYHPANARFFIYGDIPTAEWTGFLAPRLKGLASAKPPRAVYRPRHWKEPRRTCDSYPIGESEPDTERTYFGMFWLAGDSLDPREHILFRLLSAILMGNDAAPLKKAVVDSKLGKGLSNSGAFEMGPQVVFSVGLKGSEPDKGRDFESLVLSTLEKTAGMRIDAELVDTAFQQIAYESLEITSGYPISRMNRTLAAWLFGKDPATFLETAAHLESCRAAYRQDPDIFNQLIRTRFLENNHRLFHTLTPDRKWQERRQENDLRRMKKKRESLSDDDALKIAERASDLDELSGQPDPPEAMARLPRLRTADLPGKPRTIPVVWSEPAAGLKIARNQVFSNGVNYLNVAMDMDGLPVELWPYVPRFCQAFEHMGTGNAGYAEIARRKAAHTGGIYCHHSLLTAVPGPVRDIPCMMISLKTLDGKMTQGLDIVEDLLFGLDPRDMDRLSVISQQALTDARRDAVQNAMETATIHAGRNVSVRGQLAHLTDGLHQLGLLESLVARKQDGLDELARKIGAIRDFMMTGGRITAGFTGSDESFDAVRQKLSSWARCRKTLPSAALPRPVGGPAREGLAGAVDISYCACIFETMPFMNGDSPFLELGAHMVSHEYILTEIRTRGTAYGAGFRYSPFDSNILVYSYRDPQIARTLSVIGALPDFVRTAKWSQDDIEQAAIAVTKKYLRPVRPDNATSETLFDGITGMVPELRAKRFARIKSATPSDVKRALLSALEHNFSTASVCVVSNRGKLDEANRELGPKPLKIEDILA